MPLIRALASGLVANATNVALLVGAMALLVDSATRPGLAAVAPVLIGIELLAFLRSPLRFGERISSHRLGFDAVTLWRQWLIESIGRWNFRRWRTFAVGDLLERSLRDTDELQDLWLRCVIPGVGTVVTTALADLFIGLLPPHGAWWSIAGLLALLQLLGVVGLFANVGPLIRADRSLRSVRGAFQATLVELSVVTPELILLGGYDFVDQRLQRSRDALRRAERTFQRQQRTSVALPVIVTVASMLTFGVLHPHASATWLVVVAMLVLSSFEMLITVRVALDTAVAVSAAAERLELLEAEASSGNRAWPNDPTIRARHLRITEEDTVLVADASFDLRGGRRVAITGASGSGKSTLLRALGGLDTIDGGTLLIGDVTLSDIEESQLRQHLIYVPSEPGVMRGYAFDVVQLGRAGSRSTHEDLAALGLTAERSTTWEELSRGERERIAIVRALVTGPDVYLLDEPTAGLGDAETRAVLSMLASTGASVIVASHDPQVVDWCDEVFELADGELRLV
jgi:ABC-type transport system involved in cytochrome bd biosynthesis fused ATPase/permease subunit